MNLLSTLAFSTLLLSCGAATSKTDQVAEKDTWQKSNHIYTTHTYLKSGLLDSSFKTTHFYEDGILLDSFKSIVVRKYENGKLINERGYTLNSDGTKTLSNELIQQYDTDGNLILKINKMGGNIISKTSMKYNSERQIIEAINLFQKAEHNPNDYILDSAFAHRNDKKHLKYDTTIITYQYDKSGNQIKTVTADTKRVIRKMSFSLYAGNELVRSFDLGPEGDTLSTIDYLKDGSFTKQIANLKELGSVDTMWFDNGKIVKVIGSSPQMSMRYKHISEYNDRGDEIESISYQ